MFKYVVVIGLASALMQHAHGHGGRLNSEGCHKPKWGDYHCHQMSKPANNESGPNTNHPQQPHAKYDREDYGGWIDADGIVSIPALKC